MDKNKNKILIVGCSAKEYALAKKLLEQKNIVYVAPGNDRIKDLTECIDIRENKPEELLEFVLENGIDLTICTSELALKSDITDIFQANDQKIFAPSAKSAEIALSRSAAKRFLYKLRIPTPRFGTFDKIQSSIDYLKTAAMPQVIRADEASNGADRLVCTTYSSAKTFAEDLFCRNEAKIVLEDFVFGHEFTFYVVTDGYKAIHLATVANFKFMENGNGGILTPGVGAFTPDYKISFETEQSIMNNVVNRVLDALQKKDIPYLGILGIECVLNNDGHYVVLGFNHFLQDHDSQAILNLVDEDLFSLFEACTLGIFADDYAAIKVSDNSSVSCVISSKTAGKTIENLDLIEADITPFNINKNSYLELETTEGRTLVLTKTSKTITRACKEIYEDAELIKFNGKKYRTDICENVEKF